LITLIVSLFLFTNSSLNIREQLDISPVNKVILYQEVLENNAYLIARESFVKTYIQFVNEEKIFDSRYFEGKVSGVPGDISFFGGFSNFSSDFYSKFNNKLQTNFVSNLIFSKDLEVISNFDSYAQKSSISLDNSTIAVNLKEIPLSLQNEKSGLYVHSSLPIVFNFDVHAIGLNSFEEIYLAKQLCRNFNEALLMEACYESNLQYYNISVTSIAEGGKEFNIAAREETLGRPLVVLESKMSYVQDTLKPIRFAFIAE